MIKDWEDNLGGRTGSANRKKETGGRTGRKDWEQELGREMHLKMHAHMKKMRAKCSHILQAVHKNMKMHTSLQNSVQKCAQTLKICQHIFTNACKVARKIQNVRAKFKKLRAKIRANV